MNKYAHIVISRLKQAWIIDIANTDNPVCSIFQLRHPEDNFFEYFLNAACSPPSNYETSHNNLGATEYLSFFAELELSKMPDNLIDEVLGNLSGYCITGNLYSIEESSLVDVINKLLSKVSIEYPYIRDIAGSFLKDIKPAFREFSLESMRFNHLSHEKSIEAMYLHDIEQARKLFSDQLILERISKAVRGIFKYERSEGLKSYFDKNLKIITADMEYLRATFKDFRLSSSMNIGMVALGAFGFKDSKGVIYFGLQRILQSHLDHNDRHNWKDIDIWILAGLNYNTGVGDVLNKFFYERYWNSSPLFAYAPLRDIMPGGFHMPKDEYIAYTDIQMIISEFSMFSMGNLDIDDDDPMSIRGKYGWPVERGKSIDELF
jgi:hypothetical protein